MPLSFTSDTFANFASTTLAGGAGGGGTNLATTDTTLSVPTGAGASFPSGTFAAVLGSGSPAPEVIWVSSRSGDTFTITRAQEGSVAQIWAPGTLVQHVLTAGVGARLWSAVQSITTQVNSNTTALTTAPFTLTQTVPASGVNIVFGGKVTADTTDRIQLGIDSSGYGKVSAGLGGASLTADLLAGASGWTIPQSLTLGGSLATGQSASAAVIASSGTITTSGVGVARVAPAAAVTGIILQAGTVAGQQVQVVNESANTLTFAVSATSHVADGTSDIIAASAGSTYVWDSATSLWYRLGGGTAGGGGGASTSDHYLVGQGGQGDSDLTSKTVIPGLSGSPDIYAGGANDWEFDTTTLTGWSTFTGGGAVSANDANTTTKSQLTLSLATNSGVDAFAGLIHAAPTIPYTVTAKLTDWDCVDLDWAALFVSDSATAAGNSVLVGAANVAGTYGARGGTMTNLATAAGLVDTGRIGVLPPRYLRIVVHAANNIDILASQHGLVWKTLATGYSLLTTAGFVGLAGDANAGAGALSWDWIRFS